MIPGCGLIPDAWWGHGEILVSKVMVPPLDLLFNSFTNLAGRTTAASAGLFESMFLRNMDRRRSWLQKCRNLHNQNATCSREMKKPSICGLACEFHCQWQCNEHARVNVFRYEQNPQGGYAPAWPGAHVYKIPQFSYQH